MEVFRPEVHALFLSPFLDELRSVHGDAEVQALVASFGISEESLRDKEAWVSLEFCEEFCRRLYERHNDPAIFDRCGRLALTPRYLGILRPLFRAFGTPMFAFTQAASAASRFNKVGSMKLLEWRRGFVRLEYRSLPGAARERSTLVCRTRAAQLGGIPTMFDLPAAKVRHAVCMHAGGESCVYDLEWREPAGKRFSRTGFAGGLLLGAIAGSAAGLAAPLHAALAAVGALVLWSMGKVIELRRDLGQRVLEIHDYHDALTRSASAAEERYAQLLQTKSEIELKVEERTARLTETGERLEATLKQVRALKEAEKNFYANVSHDLRTPLTLILAPIGELLERRDLSEQARRYLEAVRRNAEQLRKMIDQLLDLEKVDAGRVELTRAPVDPAAFLRTIEEQFSAAASASGIALDVGGTPPQPQPASPSPSPSVIWADTGWIDSALQNLVVNALRFAKSRVRVKLGEGADAVVFQVEDDGEGIAPEDLPRIFDRFAQGGDAARRKSGTGLGLTLAREAARLHGGSLTVASAPGAGATFTLTLPRGSAPAGVAAPVPAAAQGPQKSRPAALVVGPRQRSWPGPGRDAPLVLVVEDDDDLRELIGEVLSERCRVEAARDGAEGLEMAFRLRPDAIVSDISMPKRDGYQLCRAIREREESYRVPILLLTARAHLPRVLEGFRAGADDYIAKPFHPPELVARLNVHLLLGRLLRELAHRERLATLGLVAASIAHQVRNPLSALQSTVEALKDRVDGHPRTGGMFELIAECTARIEKLTDDLLDLSRVDRDARARFRPADGIRACVRVLEARLPTDIRIVTAIDEAVEVIGRPGDLNHVFLNLIDNAARAITGRGTVSVTAGRSGDDFVFEVGDSGPGIPEAEREAIFEPFYSTRAAGEGTGLGLFLAKKIVGAHHGTIAVGRSDLGGAAFVVRVPRADRAAAGDAGDDDGADGSGVREARAR
jgi:signal transduction histidine kinase